MTTTQKRKRRRRSRRSGRTARRLFRDAFFFLVATAILFHEVVVREDDIRPVAAFMVLWFYGMIPVSVADDARKAAGAWLISQTPEGVPDDNDNDNGG